MKSILSKLKESIELEEHLIQFRIGDEFYELVQSRRGDWSLFTVFGKELKLNVKKLKGLDKEEVEDILKKKYPKVDIY